MAAATLQNGSNGRLEIHGDLNFGSVQELWGDCCNRISECAGLDIDLHRVQRSDSAGLALLVECLRRARQSGKPIRFFNIPAQMLSMARVSGLDQVLPLHRDG